MVAGDSCGVAVPVAVVPMAVVVAVIVVAVSSSPWCIVRHANPRTPSGGASWRVLVTVAWVPRYSP